MENDGEYAIGQLILKEPVVPFFTCTVTWHAKNVWIKDFETWDKS